MDKIMENKWINTDEAAEYLGVKATTIREWIKGFPLAKLVVYGSLKKTNSMNGSKVERVQQLTRRF